MSNWKIGKQINLEKTKKSKPMHGKLYHQLVKVLGFKYGVPITDFSDFFKYCSEYSSQKTQNYLDKQFRKKIILEKEEIDEYYCEECGATDDLTLHHIKKKSEYPERRYDMENIQILCRDCHQRLHPHEDKIMQTDTLRMKMLGIEEKVNVDLPVRHTIPFNISDHDKIVVGDKIQETLTMNLGFSIGDIIEAHFIKDDNILEKEYLVVSGLDKKQFSEIGDIDAISEGYGNIGEYREYLEHKYSSITSNQTVHMIIFTCINND